MTMYEYSLNDADQAAIDHLQRCIACGDEIGDIAKEAGIRVDFLVAMIDGRKPYFGRPSRVDEVAELYEALVSWHTKEISNPPFAETPTFMGITKHIAYAHAAGKALSIIGGVGIGKTIAQLAYCRGYPRTPQSPGALRIILTEDCASAKNALWKVYCALYPGQASSALRFRRSDMQDGIVRALRKDDILLFDEANHLDESIDSIRDIYDRVAGKVGMVFLGNPKFDSLVYAESDKFSAFANRARPIRYLQSTLGDVQVWCLWAGGGWTDNTVLPFAISVGAAAGKYSGLRSLSDVRDYLIANYPDTHDDAALILSTLKQFYPEVFEAVQKAPSARGKR